MSAVFGTVVLSDRNLGTVAITIIQGENGRNGAIEITGILLLNRDKYLAGEGLLECLTLADRYNGAAEARDRINNPWPPSGQSALGYLACNFVDPAVIQFPSY
jgi:hypothetical protein